PARRARQCSADLGFDETKPILCSMFTRQYPLGNIAKVALKSIKVLISPGRKASSLVRLAAIEVVERGQDLADLAPQRKFVAAEAVEREVGLVGQAQKAARELHARTEFAARGCRRCRGHVARGAGNVVRM